jgi:AraC family transcriptional regulator, regulatory protein of adaptative response / DNA-3-methyladenine glycosylase II
MHSKVLHSSFSIPKRKRIYVRRQLVAVDRSVYGVAMNEMQMPSIEICDRARASRDARFDGLFFIAVRSTGIYCRPVCPAPTAKRGNVIYYPTAAAAAAAGYRPCLRCRPELSPEVRIHGNEGAMHRALALIKDGALQDGSIDALASQVGLSARQLRRLFLANTGATPVAVHATRRLLLAKQLLTETSLPVTQVALAAGFKSLRRFNSAFREACGMSPTAVRRSGTGRQHTGRKRAWTTGDILTLRLAYRPPLAFDTMLAFLAKRAIPGIERVTANGYERVFGPADSSARIRVTAAREKPELRLEISGTDPRGIPDIVRRVRRIFDLDADIHAAHTILCEDPLLAAGIRRCPGLRVPGGWDGFEVMVRAVLGQQVTVAVATTLAQRLVERHGEHRDDSTAGLDRVFPTPERLMQAPLENIGLPKSRAVTLRAVAAAMLDGHLDFRPGQRLDAFVERITELPGIGKWTAHYVAMRALNHPDAFPAADLVVQRVLGGNQQLSEREAETRSQAWRPWRAYAVLQLWHLAGTQKKSGR